MPEVTLKHPNETFESLLRRFKKAVEKSDILKVLRDYDAYEKPSEEKKRKHAAAIKRWKRTQYEMSMPAHKWEQLQQEEAAKREKKKSERRG